MSKATALPMIIQTDDEDEAELALMPPPPPPPPPPLNARDDSPFEVNDFQLHQNDEEGVSGNFPRSNSNEPSDYQVAEMRDQLMEMMMENEQLAAELKLLKENQVTVLTQQLTEEKERSRQLDLQLKKTPTSGIRNRKIGKRRDEILYKSKSMGELSNVGNEIGVVTASVSEASVGEIVTAEVAEEAILSTQFLAQQNEETQLNRHFLRVTRQWLTAKYEQLKDDFSEVQTTIDHPLTKEDEGEALNPFKLKRNLIRFGNVFDPMRDFVLEIVALSRWENPPVSLAVFTIYMVVVYKDWFISVALLIASSVFFFTYLRHKGWTFGHEIENISNTTEIEKELGVRDQISVLMVVGRRSQNDTGNAADALEKIRNVLLWREPEVTRPVVMVVCMALSLSFILPPYLLSKLAGLLVGIHIFIIKYIFYRFPRIKQKYDKVSEYILKLKTDADFEKQIRTIRKEMRKTPKRSQSMNILANGSTLSVSPSTNDLIAATEEISATNFTFVETFQLPASEVPLTLWQRGRRCTLVNKEKAFTAGFKAGKMYLTNNYLCFERSKTPSVKNLVIPLETIKSVIKAKLSHWLPGGGKAIEIKMKLSGKAYIFVFQVILFGAIVNRDEAYQSIMEIGEANNFSWAKSLPQDT